MAGCMGFTPAGQVRPVAAGSLFQGYGSKMHSPAWEDAAFDSAMISKEMAWGTAVWADFK